VRSPVHTLAPLSTPSATAAQDAKRPHRGFFSSVPKQSQWINVSERACRLARRARLFSERIVASVCVPATIGAQTGDTVGRALGSLEDAAAGAESQSSDYIGHSPDVDYFPGNCSR
jgi:hypothetical protein